MALLGLGFAFGAKDTGLSKAQEKYTQGFGRMGDSAKTLDKILSGVRMGNFLESLSLSNLNRIQRGMEQLITDSGNLTTSFEGTLHQNFKTTQAMGVNFGYAGKQLQKFSSAAQSMNLRLGVDIEKAGQAIRSYEEISDDLKIIGIKNADELAKYIEVSGQDIGEFRNSIKGMRKVLNMSDKDIQGFVGSFQAMGERTKDVGASMKLLPEMVSQLNKHAVVMGKRLNPDQLADLAKQAAAAAAGFYDLGFSGDEARKMAMGLSEKLMESQKNIANVFAGTETGPGQLLESLGIATGDITASFDLMKEGPAGFIKGMNKLVGAMRDKGMDTNQSLNLMRAHLEKAFGEEGAVGLMQMFSKMTGKTLDSMDKVERASADLGKIHKGYKDARTLAELHNLTQDMFIAKLRRASNANKEFFKETSAAYKQWGDSLVKLSKEDGPMGKFVKVMIEAHQIGAKAFIPKTLWPMADLAGILLKEFGPLVGVLHSMGLKMSDLVNPFAWATAAAVGLAGWFTTLTLQGHKAGDALNIMGEDILSVVDKIPEYIDKAVTTIFAFMTGDFSVFDLKLEGGDKWKETWTKVGHSMLRAFSKLGDVFLKLGQGFLDGFTGNFDAASATREQQIGAKIGDFIGKAFDAALEWAKGKVFGSVDGFMLTLGAAFILAPGITGSVITTFSSLLFNIATLFLTSSPGPTAIFTAIKGLVGGVAGALKGIGPAVMGTVGKAGVAGAAAKLGLTGAALKVGAVAGGKLALAGAAGYGLGTLIDKGVTALSGQSLGEHAFGWFGDEKQFSAADEFEQRKKTAAAIRQMEEAKKNESNTAPAKAVPLPEMAALPPHRSQIASMDAVAAAVHHPVWYEDFKRMFAEMMRRTGGPSPSGSGSGGSSTSTNLGIAKRAAKGY